MNFTFATSIFTPQRKPGPKYVYIGFPTYVSTLENIDPISSMEFPGVIFFWEISPMFSHLAILQAHLENGKLFNLWIFIWFQIQIFAPPKALTSAWFFAPWTLKIGSKWNLKRPIFRGKKLFASWGFIHFGIRGQMEFRQGFFMFFILGWLGHRANVPKDISQISYPELV